MNNKQLITTNQNSQVALLKSKKLLDITKNILESKDDEYIENLLQWFNNNIIQNKSKYPKTKDEIIKTKTISIGWNRLKELPIELFNLSKLEILELNNNNLKLLPKEIANLKNLKILNLNINFLETLPNEIVQLKKLESLNIKNNKYLELNKEQICWIKELKNSGCNVIYDKYKIKLGA